MTPKPVLAGWPVALALFVLIGCHAAGLIDTGDAIVAAVLVLGLSGSVIFGGRITR